MPKYSNDTERYQGGEYLKIPPNTTDHSSIFQYDPTNADFDITASGPYYNPIKFKELIKFSGQNEYIIDFPYTLIEGDKHLVIYTQCDNVSYDSIEVFFNDDTNLPSLPLTNSEFAIFNFNRVKRIVVKTKDSCNGEVLVMISDKYVPAVTNIPEPAPPNKSAGN